MWALGTLLQDGWRDARGRATLRRNPAAAFRLFVRAANAGDTSGAFSLGYAYDLGVGTKPDKRLALHWYRRAARDGHSAAPNNIATIYRDEHKYDLAFQWWERGLAMRDGDAGVQVGYCYQYGIGTRRNPVMARHVFRRAISSRDISEAGREEAMYHLAVADIDDGKTSLAIPLLKRASKDDDYPEAKSLLEQIRSKRAIHPCRCRRGIYKQLPGHARCPLHPRSARALRVQSSRARGAPR